jgi:hypothetical protein
VLLCPLPYVSFPPVVLSRYVCAVVLADWWLRRPLGSMVPAGKDRPDKAIGRSERDFNNRKCFRLKPGKGVFDEQWEGKEKETKGLPLAAPYSHFKFSLFAHMHMSDFDLHVFTRPCQC